MCTPNQHHWFCPCWVVLSISTTRHVLGQPLHTPQNCPFTSGICTSSNTTFLGPTRVYTPNSTSIGSAIFAGFTIVTDWQSDWQTDQQAPKDVFVCSVLIYVQRIRGFTMMRYINLRFTYLLTFTYQGLWTEATCGAKIAEIWLNNWYRSCC